MCHGMHRLVYLDSDYCDTLKIYKEADFVMEKSVCTTTQKRESAGKIILKVISSLAVGTVAAVGFGYLVSTVMGSILK